MRRVGVWASLVLLAAVAVTLGFFGPFRSRGETLRLPAVVEIQEVRLGSKIGGRVAEVLVMEGDVVEANQLLVRFEAPELEAQYEQQQARVDMALAEWAKAVNGPRPEEIRQAKSEVETADADVRWARDDFDRAERQYRQGSMARADYDTARASRDRAIGRHAAARARLDLLEAGTCQEDKDLAQARFEEACGRLLEIKAQLDEALVRAKEKSLVEVVAVRKGDLVPPNTPVIRVLRALDLWVKVYVPETELGKVRLGQTVGVTMDSYPGRKFTGTVFHIASESEFTPRNVQSIDERRHQVFGVKVRVSDPEGIFKSGMAAEVTFRFGNGPNGPPRE
jgi:multidrug resistance efflux pump